MFLREESRSEINKAGKRGSYKMHFFRCDHCGSEFSKRSAKRRLIEFPHHFCNVTCTQNASKKGGLIYNLKKSHCLEKYGTEHHLQNKEIQEKRITTCERVYGGRAPLSSAAIREKISKTNEERYGGHFSRSEKIKEKRRATCLEKYGVDSFSKTSNFKESINWNDLARKGFETRKKKGISNISKIEKLFGEFLERNFGTVESQVEVNNWAMDFYIPSINTYVQFDGDYWHGLDMSIEQLLESNKPQFHIIAKTKMRDALRQEWFSNNKMKLVRIRESDFKKKLYDRIINSIQGEIHGI